LEFVIAFSLLAYVFESYLSWRQRVKLLEKEKPTELTFVSDEDFAKTQSYGLDKSNFGFGSGVFSQAMKILSFVLTAWWWKQSGIILEYFGFEAEQNEVKAKIVCFYTALIRLYIIRLFVIILVAAT
jgi:STE24 endopeptidase